MLRELGFRTTALHSKMSQNDRIASLAKFRSGVVPILLATDVGSRYVSSTCRCLHMDSGLDIPAVQVVLNYDIPLNAADYVHRVGRTARAGRGGKSIAFVTEIDVELILNIEAKIGKYDVYQILEMMVCR